MTSELCQLAEDGVRTCLALTDGVLFMGPAFAGGSTQEGFVQVIVCFLAGFGVGLVKRTFDI